MSKRTVLVLAVLISSLSVAALFSQDQGAYWRRWQEAEKAGDWKAAELAMRDALSGFPADADFASSLAWALRRQKRPEEAVSLLEPLFAKNSGAKSLREALAYSLLDIGWKSYETAEYVLAFAPFARAFGLLPEDRYVANAYGSVLRDTGRVAEGLPILEKGHAAFPDDGYLKGNLHFAYVARANEVAEKDGDEAERLFAKAAAIDPGSEAYLLSYGNFLSGRRRYREALPFFEECLERYPANAWVKGNIQYALQETERALAAAGDHRAAYRAAETAHARFPRETWFVYDLYEYARKLGELDTADKWLRLLATEPALLDYGKPLAVSREELVIHRLGGLVFAYASRGEFAKGFELIDAVGKGFPGALFVEETRGNLLFHSGRKDAGIAAVNAVYDRYIQSHREYASPLVLALPLEGSFLVFGNNRPDTVTHAGMSRFCFDFMGADEAGSILKPGKSSPGGNGDYYGFGAEVLAAAEGVVESVEDGYVDIEPRLTPVLGDGNSVVVKDGRGYHYNYVHLKKGSVVVAPGQKVSVGQRLAKLGNSGYTAFPHLHFGVYSPDWRVSIPVLFRRYAAKSGTKAWTTKENSAPATGDIIRKL